MLFCVFTVLSFLIPHCSPIPYLKFNNIVPQLIIEAIIRAALKERDPLRWVIAKKYVIENSKDKFNGRAFRQAMTDTIMLLEEEQKVPRGSANSMDVSEMAEELTRYNRINVHEGTYKERLILCASDNAGLGKKEKEAKTRYITNYKEFAIKR